MFPSLYFSLVILILISWWKRILKKYNNSSLYLKQLNLIQILFWEQFNNSEVYASYIQVSLLMMKFTFPSYLIPTKIILWEKNSRQNSDTENIFVCFLLLFIQMTFCLIFLNLRYVLWWLYFIWKWMYDVFFGGLQVRVK